MNQDRKYLTEASATCKTEGGSITLRVQAGIGENLLLLHYAVLNGFRQTVYLVNRVFQWTQKGLSVDASLMYTELIDGALQLTKACIPVPPHIRVESPDVPYLTSVPSGERATEEYQLPLPLTPFHPYSQVPQSQTPHIFKPIVFALGWFPAGTVSIRSQERPEGKTMLSANYGEVIQAQEVLRVTLPLSIPAYIAVKES